MVVNMEFSISEGDPPNSLDRKKHGTSSSKMDDGVPPFRKPPFTQAQGLH